jgi:hypothetical protein
MAGQCKLWRAVALQGVLNPPAPPSHVALFLHDESYARLGAILSTLLLYPT